MVLFPSRKKGAATMEYVIKTNMIGDFFLFDENNEFIAMSSRTMRPLVELAKRRGIFSVKFKGLHESIANGAS
jgi:hypothetical protein